jgi:hypothetical protein
VHIPGPTSPFMPTHTTIEVTGHHADATNEALIAALSSGDARRIERAITAYLATWGSLELARVLAARGGR